MKIKGKASRIVMAEFRRIREKNGVLNAALVVEAARHKSSPLHRYFTWDDSDAAVKFRLWQARELMGSVRLEVSYGKSSETVRAQVRVVTARGPSYEPLAKVLSNDALREQLVNSCLRDMRLFESKYSVISKLVAATIKAMARDRAALERKLQKAA